MTSFVTRERAEALFGAYGPHNDREASTPISVTVIPANKPWSISDFANGDGTYNGVAFLAALTGVPAAEVAWTAERIKALTAQGLPRPYIHAVVTEERKSNPWKK